MNRLIVADESVDFAIIQLLIDEGYEVCAIVREYAGWSDSQVLAFAYAQNAYLITEDKDFGELTYRLRRPSHGILLIRLIDESSEEKAALTLSVIQTESARLLNAFSVLEAHKLRIKPLVS